MPSQDILLGDIAPEMRAWVERELRDHGITLASNITPVRRWALACPALPTCGLALTEAERVQQLLVTNIEAVLERHGLTEERLSIRMTGCPNGCARPYTGDIGIVGRMPGYYALYVGGDFEGTRLSRRLLDKVALSDIPDALELAIADAVAAVPTNRPENDLAGEMPPPEHGHPTPPLFVTYPVSLAVPGRFLQRCPYYYSIPRKLQIAAITNNMPPAIYHFLHVIV
jgi:sulfite reductase beta subunit-like hemoprotein